jgi:hypothetical protein
VIIEAHGTNLDALRRDDNAFVLGDLAGETLADVATAHRQSRLRALPL